VEEEEEEEDPMDEEEELIRLDAAIENGWRVLVM
jgi:hypothetical protein